MSTPQHSSCQCPLIIAGESATVLWIEKTLSVKYIYLLTLALRSELSGTIRHGMAHSFLHSYY